MFLFPRTFTTSGSGPCLTSVFSHHLATEQGVWARPPAFPHEKTCAAAHPCCHSFRSHLSKLLADLPVWPGVQTWPSELQNHLRSRECPKFEFRKYRTYWRSGPQTLRQCFPPRPFATADLKQKLPLVNKCQAAGREKLAKAWPLGQCRRGMLKLHLRQFWLVPCECNSAGKGWNEWWNFETLDCRPAWALTAGKTALSPALIGQGFWWHLDSSVMFCKASTKTEAMALGYAVSWEVTNCWAGPEMPHFSCWCVSDTPSHILLMTLNSFVLKARVVRFGRLLPCRHVWKTVTSVNASRFAETLSARKS